MSLCNNCDTCKPISNDCFCNFSPIKGVKLESIQPSVHLAAEHFNSLINECYDICEEPEDEDDPINKIKSNKKFKLYFARLLYSYWLCDYGSGESTPNGVVYKQGDNTSDFEVSKDNTKKQVKQGSILEGLELKFMTWFKKEFPKCIPCQKEITTCGCNKNPCSCNHQKQSSLLSYEVDDFMVGI